MAFIRRKRVHTCTSEGRKDYFYYYRLENYWTDDCPKPKQRVLDYLGMTDKAIAKLEASEANQEEKTKLLARLRSLIGEELGTTPQV
ncbi:hypothetical protein H6F95_19835 [Cyanobacteria bacterium FACHB-471]|nr:hypothetical protein [Cyanobacteria bacterium FACHB-471]